MRHVTTSVSLKNMRQMTQLLGKWINDLFENAETIILSQTTHHIKAIDAKNYAISWPHQVITTRAIGLAWRPTARMLCSICIHSFGDLAKAVRLFIASLHNQPTHPKMCSIDIFINLQPVGWNLNNGGLFDLWFGGLWWTWGRGWAYIQ